MNFYDILKNECDNRKIKMTPLVQKCGGSTGNISNWKKGASPNSDVVLKIAKQLNISTDYLLGNIPPENKTDNSNNSGVIVGNNNTHIRINSQERELTKQEQALLQIYNNADGKTQMKIMQFMYDLEEKN